MLKLKAITQLKDKLDTVIIKTDIGFSKKLMCTLHTKHCMLIPYYGLKEEGVYEEWLCRFGCNQYQATGTKYAPNNIYTLSKGIIYLEN